MIEMAKLNALFVLGNMGTGKSYWIKNAGFENMGFWLYNVDRYLHFLGRREKLMNPHEALYEQTEQTFLRFNKAVNMATGPLKHQIDQLRSVVIESTGNNFSYLMWLKSLFDEKPYRLTFYILHNSLEQKIENNQYRRTIGENAPPDELIKGKEAIFHMNMDLIRTSFENVFEFDLTQHPFQPYEKKLALEALISPLEKPKDDYQFTQVLEQKIRKMHYNETMQRMQRSMGRALS